MSLEMSTSTLRRLLSRPSHIRRLVFPQRTATTTETGAVLPNPPRPYSFGLLRIGLVAVPFTYLGAMVAKYFADYLETENIFVPEDDDD